MYKKTSLSKKIRDQRIALNLTQKELAEQLYVSPQAVSRWENDISFPDIKIIPKLASLLGADLDSLLGDYSAIPDAVSYHDVFKPSGGHCATGKICELTREILRIMPPERQVRLLDIGCGEGQASIFFARNGYDVTALDISDAKLDQGRRMASMLGVNIKFFRADIIEFEFKKDFDVIYSAGILKHIAASERRRVIGNLQRHTTIGGVNAFNVFVDKKFLPPAPDWDRREHLWKSAEIFSHYADDWFFELMKEKYIDHDRSETPHRHCLDVMIARKLPPHS